MKSTILPWSRFFLRPPPLFQPLIGLRLSSSTRKLLQFRCELSSLQSALLALTLSTTTVSPLTSAYEQQRAKGNGELCPQRTSHSSSRAETREIYGRGTSLFIGQFAIEWRLQWTAGIRRRTRRKEKGHQPSTTRLLDRFISSLLLGNNSFGVSVIRDSRRVQMMQLK